MTHAAAVVAPVDDPPFDIVRVTHAELLVTDLDASLRFYERLLGLIVTERTADAVYLRGWEERHHHSLVLRQAEHAALGHIAFRVRREADLDLIEADLRRRGCPTRWHDDAPGQGRALRTQDPLGFPLEFFHAMAPADSQLQRFDLHRGAPVMRFDHVNLHVSDPDRALVFWRELGFAVTEYIATDGDPGQVTGAWLCRKPTVHDVALTTGTGPRLHHLGLTVADPMGVLRACDQLAAAGSAGAIERGPGRHGVSNAFFVYLRDPDGHRIELYTGDYYTGDPDLEPKRWSASDATCRTFWGARAPDSWYEESTRVLDLDGAAVEVSAAAVDERSALAG